MNTCDGCKNFVANIADPTQRGECHLNPPQPAMVSWRGNFAPQPTVAVWAPVLPNDWCARWAAKP